MLLPGHPGGVNWYEQRFWTAAYNCDLEQKADFVISNSWHTEGMKMLKLLHGFRISPTLADLCHKQIGQLEVVVWGGGL